MTKSIELGSNLYALVDDEDYEAVSQYTWTADIRPNTIYATASMGSRKNRERLHRFIMKPNADEQVDHINRDGLDCRRCNMRITNHQGNGRNIIQPQTSTGSGYRGVYKHHSSERWIARIRDDTGHKKHLGMYATKEEAAKAYDEAAKLYHGEFAVTNF